MAQSLDQTIQLAIQKHSSGALSEAEALYRKILMRQPGLADVRHLLGLARYQQGDFNEAIQRIRSAIQVQPNIPFFHFNLGKVLADAQRPEEAQAAYEQAVTLKPDYLEAWENLGNLLLEQEALEPAARCYGQALTLNPNSLNALRGLGTLLWRQGEHAQAHRFYQKAIQLHHDAGCQVRMVAMLPEIMPSRAAIEQERTRVTQGLRTLMAQGVRLHDPLREVGFCNFYAAYHGLDDKPLQSLFADFYLQACPSLAMIAPHCQHPGTRLEGRKIQIGFASHFLKNHTVGRYLSGIIRLLDRERFEVHLLVTPGGEDALGLTLRHSADQVHRLPMNLAAARQVIAGAQLDILVYPEIGIHPLCYFLSFARLAPVQCAFYGHPVTTGVPTIDYFLSQVDCEPPDAVEHYRERLWLASGAVTYTCFPRPTLPDPLKPRAAFGLEEGAHLYFCPQMLMKIHPDFDELAARILRQDAQARLLFIAYRPAWGDLLLTRMASLLTSEEQSRITFLPRQSHGDYLNLAAVCDVVLDTPHFSGGGSSFDILATGTPIITLPGPFMRSRQTSSLYQRLGLCDLIAINPETYVQYALRAATDSAWNHSLRQKILTAGTLIYDDPGIVRELEQFWEKVVR